MQVTISPGGIQGAVRIPASKSHTIRALLIATLADGRSTIRNPLVSLDSRACMAACRQFGARIDEAPDEWTVRGTGGALRVPDDVIHVGNSGTTLRLAMSAASLIDGYTVFTGDEQIRRRPVGNLLESLIELGAEGFTTRGNGCAPVAIRGRLRGGTTSIECPTSQFLSSLLLAAPLAGGESAIHVPLLNERPYVDLTLWWLDNQGIDYAHDGYERFHVNGGQSYHGFDRAIAADFSSATFFLCAAAMTHSELTLRGLDLTDPQGDKAVIEYLKAMGCSIDAETEQLTIRGGELRGCELDLNATPDALPGLAAVACVADGETRLVNVPQARLKETDRIAVMAEELRKLGGHVKELPDGLVVGRSDLVGAPVEGHGDHRVVMALAIAALAASGTTVIDGAEAAEVTFPEFFQLLDEIRIR
jgi:3-phosphoshikimate 1-carboxyvinyltransferase